MLIERDDAVILEDGECLADTFVGGLWTTFRNSIPSLQSKELDKAFNFIMMADEDSLMPSQISHVLVDEYLDLPTKKQTVYVIIATNIIELLVRLGVVLNDDVAGEDKLAELNILAGFFYDLKEYEDIIGLKGLLESQDIPPVNRYLQAMTVFYGEEFDVSEFECLIEDVSEVTIKAIKDALFNPDDVETPPASLQRRIIENKGFLAGTKAYDHVTSNGQLGGAVSNFLNFFKDYLEDLLEDATEKNMLQYAKEVLGFFIISEINDEWLKDKASQYLYSIITDVVTLTKVEAMIEEVIIPS